MEVPGSSPGCSTLTIKNIMIMQNDFDELRKCLRDGGNIEEVLEEVRANNDKLYKDYQIIKLENEALKEQLESAESECDKKQKEIEHLTIKSSNNMINALREKEKYKKLWLDALTLILEENNGK